MYTRRHYATCTNVLPLRSCVRPDFEKQRTISSGELLILVSLSLTLMSYGPLCSMNLRVTRRTVAQLCEGSRGISSRSRSGLVLENTCLMKPVSMISVSRFAFFLSFPPPLACHLVPPLSTSHHQSTCRQLTLFPLFPCFVPALPSATNKLK